MNVLPVLHVCTVAAHNHRSQKRALAPFDLELGVTVSHLTGAGELDPDPLQVHLTPGPSLRPQVASILFPPI